MLEDLPLKSRVWPAKRVCKDVQKIIMGDNDNDSDLRFSQPCPENNLP